MLKICIANLKGGVGKTTTAINLAYGLAQLGRRVCLVDVDPQASLTQAAGVDTDQGSLADVLGGAIPGRLTLREIIQPLAPGVDLVPAALDLANCELGLVSRLGREAVLKKALASLKDYDLAILDCGPSIALLAVNALVAADAVIAPVVPDALGLRGLALFLSSLESIRSELNPSLQLLGVVVCMYDGRLTLHREALADLSAGNLTVLAIISKGIAAARSAGEGIAIPSGSKLADQYFDLSKEIDQWLRNNP